MYGIWDSNMFQTNVHEYSAELQNENNNNIEYKTRLKTPEIFPENKIITSFDDLKITEWPGEIEVPEYENNNTSANTEEKDEEKIEKPKRIKEAKFKKLKKPRTVHDPICIHHIPLEAEEIDSHMFAPVLKRRKKRDGCSPDTLVIDKNSKMNGYDSDETVNDYVECGREGMCKCRRMQGREYYEDYIQMEGRDYLKLYSHGKRDFHYGTVLHFTGAPEHMQREDLYLALVELGNFI
ncbi:uncharacterized protein LOC111352352 [Spodoptera litura]|uniref:Uncharacterized protein LOC111352352 n=1 Tax=Spodoptera litura TaxID=69820 RepID=A0A9J7E2E4_SPOLT|nr:uncharacterized protein LOC111352352 [Spodoptera litura]